MDFAENHTHMCQCGATFEAETNEHFIRSVRESIARQTRGQSIATSNIAAINSRLDGILEHFTVGHAQKNLSVDTLNAATHELNNDIARLRSSLIDVNKRMNVLSNDVRAKLAQTLNAISENASTDIQNIHIRLNYLEKITSQSDGNSDELQAVAQRHLVEDVVKRAEVLEEIIEKRISVGYNAQRHLVEDLAERVGLLEETIEELTGIDCNAQSESKFDHKSAKETNDTLF